MKFPKPLSAVLVVAMLVTVTVVSIPADDTMKEVTLVDSPFYDSDMYKVSFEYSSGGQLDYRDVCYYTDEYFFTPSTSYDQSLATASLCFAMSAFHSFKGKGYSNGSDNVEHFLKNTGFLDFEANEDFGREPTTDSIGLAIANKHIHDGEGDYTLIALAVRGSGYGAEWVENFQMGTGDESDGHHEGFYNAMNRTLDFMESYIESKNIAGDIKLWMTGYSRGAAVSNMVAGNIDTSIAFGEPVLGGDVSLAKEDMFTYTFGTPMGAHFDEDSDHPDPRCEYYNNIWNIINRNDFIVKLAMEACDFCRYGNDVVLPDQRDSDYEELKEIMLEFYMSSDSIANLEPYAIDEFVAYRLDIVSMLSGGNPLIIDESRVGDTQGDVLDSLVDNITNAIGGREGYVNKVQGGFCELLSDMYEYGSEYQINAFLQVMAYALMNMEGEDGKALYITLAMDLLLSGPEDLARNLHEPVEFGLRVCGIISDEALLQEKATRFSEILASLAFVLKDNILVDAGCVNDLVSLAMNFNTIAVAHYPESTLSWLKCEDRNYIVSYE